MTRMIRPLAAIVFLAACVQARRWLGYGDRYAGSGASAECRGLCPNDRNAVWLRDRCGSLLHQRLELSCRLYRRAEVT